MTEAEAEVDLDVVIPSHKRAGSVSTIRYVKGCLICVPEAQEAEYAEHYDPERLVTHPDSVIGISPKRQWIYETFGDVFMLDDDVEGLNRIYTRRGDFKKSRVSAEVARNVIDAAAVTAYRAGAYLFGFGSHANPAAYQELKPFKLGGYIPGGSFGMLSGSKLWFPHGESLPEHGLIGDGYWIGALNAFYHRYAWIDTRFACAFRDTYRGTGGNADLRQEGSEHKITKFLVKKFGDAIQPKNETQLTKRHRNPAGRRLAIPWKH